MKSRPPQQGEEEGPPLDAATTTTTTYIPEIRRSRRSTVGFRGPQPLFAKRGKPLSPLGTEVTEGRGASEACQNHMLKWRESLFEVWIPPFSYFAFFRWRHVSSGFYYYTSSSIQYLGVADCKISIRAFLARLASLWAACLDPPAAGPGPPSSSPPLSLSFVTHIPPPLS